MIKNSRIRKFVYAGLILGLFTATLIYRRQVLERQADSLVLREQDVGETELTGKAVRLLLTGSRGLTLAILWNHADELKKKHEWNKLDLTIQSITKLQPHSIRPWEYQSWNMAFNVSVECEQVRDRYFYISRGIQILAEGERRNRNNPDLRHSMGTFYYRKIGQADEGDHLQALFQLSCIDPVERDPERFRLPDGRIDMGEFRQFCEQHPRLIRRLRERLDFIKKPADVIDFLEDNRDIPSRYEPPEPGARSSRLKPAEKQFPILPRRQDFKQLAMRELAGADANDVVDDAFGVYDAVRVWVAYAQEPLPPPDGLPGPSPRNFDRNKYRLPWLTVAVFRDYPAKMQSYLAEQLQNEGWFDEKWEIDAGKIGSDRWFPEVVKLGGNRYQSALAWSRAHEMWEQHGRETGLLQDPQTLQDWKKRSNAYRDEFQVGPDNKGPDVTTGHPLHASFRAHRLLYWYHYNRKLTNFARFHARAKVEKEPRTVEARRHFYHGEEKRKRGELAAALNSYNNAIHQWKKILEESPEYRHDIHRQIEAYLWQHRYLQLAQDQVGPAVAHLLVLGDWLTHGAGAFAPLPPIGNLWHKRRHRSQQSSLYWGPITPPLSGLISETAKESAEMRLGWQ